MEEIGWARRKMFDCFHKYLPLQASCQHSYTKTVAIIPLQVFWNKYQSNQAVFE